MGSVIPGRGCAPGGHAGPGGRVAVVERNQALGLAALGAAPHGAQAQERYGLLHLNAGDELGLGASRQLAEIE